MVKQLLLKMHLKFVHCTVISQCKINILDCRRISIAVVLTNAFRKKYELAGRGMVAVDIYVRHGNATGDGVSTNEVFMPNTSTGLG